MHPRGEYPNGTSNPWVHDQIEVSVTQPDGTRVAFSLVGEYQCEYRSGPSLFALADHAAKSSGLRGYFGLASSRYLGFAW